MPSVVILSCRVGVYTLSDHVPTLVHGVLLLVPDVLVRLRLRRGSDPRSAYKVLRIIVIDGWRCPIEVEKTRGRIMKS
jgi:hypothetical protein